MLRVAFARWLDEGVARPLPEVMRETLGGLAALYEPAPVLYEPAPVSRS